MTPTRRYALSIQQRAADRLARADERLRAALQADARMQALLAAGTRRRGQDTRAIVITAMRLAAQAGLVRQEADAASIEHQAALHDAARLRRTRPADRRRRFALVVEGAV